jgi:hypothetical protein
LYQRDGNLSQRELEDWVEASQQEALPVDTQRYLFSSVGTMGPRMFITAKRSVVWLTVSGSALLLGLALIYFPVLRHSATLLILGVLLGLFGVLYPDVAILAAQASVLGVVLVLFARLLEWTITRRRYQRAVIRGAAFTQPEPQTGELSLRPGDGSSRVGTAPPHPVSPVSAAEP